MTHVEGPAAAAYREWLACCTEAGWRAQEGHERVALDAAVGRTVAGDVHALWSSPAQERAAMDGIAVRAVETCAATAERPLRLRPGEYEVVDTGDPFPGGRDAVIMREHVRRLSDGAVEIVAPVVPGRHVRPVGEDVVSGELLLPAGHRMRPVDVAMLAAAGHRDIAVACRPMVAILPTGDEIRPIGVSLRAGDIVDTNSLMLAAMAQESGCRTRVLPIAPDDPAVLATAVAETTGYADLVLVIAGSSAGRDDHTAGVLATLGKVAVHGVAIRPGHPVVLGVLDDVVPVPVIGVPGYPVSAAHVFDTFAAPMISALLRAAPLGAAGGPSDLVAAVLAAPVDSPEHAEDCVLVRLEERADGPAAVPSGLGAGALGRLARADAVLRIPAGVGSLAAGSRVVVERLPGAPRRRPTMTVT